MSFKHTVEMGSMSCFASKMPAVAMFLKMQDKKTSLYVALYRQSLAITSLILTGCFNLNFVECQVDHRMHGRCAVQGEGVIVCWNVHQ